LRGLRKGRQKRGILRRTGRRLQEENSQFWGERAEKSPIPSDCADKVSIELMTKKGASKVNDLKEDPPSSRGSSSVAVAVGSKGGIKLACRYRSTA